MQKCCRSQVLILYYVTDDSEYGFAGNLREVAIVPDSREADRLLKQEEVMLAWGQ